MDLSQSPLTHHAMNPLSFILAFLYISAKLQRYMRASNTPTCICSLEVSFYTLAAFQYFQQHQVVATDSAQAFLKVLLILHA